MSVGQEKDRLAGSPCPRIGCDGTLHCINSVPVTDPRSRKDYIQRYYGCKLCGCRPEDNKRRVPVENKGAIR